VLTQADRSRRVTDFMLAAEAHTVFLTCPGAALQPLMSLNRFNVLMVGLVLVIILAGLMTLAKQSFAVGSLSADPHTAQASSGGAIYPLRA
jgi:hypothetical protein